MSARSSSPVLVTVLDTPAGPLSLLACDDTLVGAGFTVDELADEPAGGEWLQVRATRRRTLADRVGPDLTVLLDMDTHRPVDVLPGVLRAFVTAQALATEVPADFVAMFVDEANLDFHLQAGSVAVGKGVTLADVPMDFDGTPRPQGQAPAIGAFELLKR